jgi:hypothetical protein
MKPTLVLALLAVLGFAAAGCGSGKKTNSGQHQYTVTLHKNVPSGTITVTGTATTAILNVKRGTHIRCKGWMGKDIRVPRLGSGLTLGESVTLSGSVTETELMSLTHRENGSITVSCQFVEPR